MLNALVDPFHIKTWFYNLNNLQNTVWLNSIVKLRNWELVGGVVVGIHCSLGNLKF